MTPAEEDLADVTLARMLGIQFKVKGAPRAATNPLEIWIWESTNPEGFGVCDTEAQAAREYLAIYLSHHRTITP